MKKDFIFYRCCLERGMASDGEPGLLAATEVVQAVCDAGFQKNGFLMKSYASSPHCYYKYAKMPKEGMYMLRAVKKTDMTTLDILIDTRLYPCFVMIEKQTDWQQEAEEVKDTLEQVINDDADKYNWHVNLREYKTNTTQNLEEFISALSYMNDLEGVPEKHKNNVQIGQLILKVDGNNYYNDDMKREEPVEVEEETQVVSHQPDEELFKFIHPSICGEEELKIHDEVKRLVTHQKIPEICQYLHLMARNNKILLPQMPSVAYAELVRMGMPTTAGYSEKYFKKHYHK